MPLSQTEAAGSWWQTFTCSQYQPRVVDPVHAVQQLMESTDYGDIKNIYSPPFYRIVSAQGPNILNNNGIQEASNIRKKASAEDATSL